jgi:cyclopropane fatty-acyl-phospholipid synthase-like methyltransferase
LVYALEVLDIINLERGGTIVEIGCGAGQFLKAMKQRYAFTQCVGFVQPPPCLNA